MLKLRFQYFGHLMQRGGSLVKNLPAYAGDANPWVRKTPKEGNGNLLQYSCLENYMGGGAWQAVVIGSQRVRH